MSAQQPPSRIARQFDPVGYSLGNPPDTSGDLEPLVDQVLNWIDEAEPERCSQCGETECREDTHGRGAQPSPSSSNE
jgi:hypothetical protein